MDSITNKVTDFHKTMGEEIKVELKNKFQPYFDQYSNLKSVKWYQHPHWDDMGYPFGIQDVGIVFEHQGNEFEWSDQNPGEEWDESLAPDEAEWNANYQWVITLASEINDYLKYLPSTIEEIFKSVFGESAEVTITREGELSWDECDRDWGG